MHEWNVYKSENLADAVTLDAYDAAFDDFLADYSENSLGEAPPALERSFMQTVQTRLLSDRNQFSKQIGDRIVRNADGEFYQTIFQGTMGRLQNGAPTEEITSWVSGNLEAHQGMDADNSPGRRRATNRRALRAMTDAAARMAMLSDDPGAAHRVLQAVQDIPTGTGTLGSSQWAQDIIRSAEDEIYGNIGQRDALAERETQQQATEIVDEARATLFDDPRASLSGFKRRLGSLGLSGESANAAINSLERFRQGLIGAQELPSDPNTRVSLWRRIITNPRDVDGNISAIEGSVVQQELSFGDAQNLYALAQNTAARAPDGGHPEEVLDDNTYDFMFREFRLLFPEDLLGGAFGITAAKREQAVSEYNAAWIDWWEGHPDDRNDPDAKIEFGLKLSERLKRRHGLINMRNSNDVQRAPELAWKAGPIMPPEVFGAIRAHVVDGMPLDAFPMRVQTAVASQFEANGIALWDDEQATAQLQRLVEYQEPFFTDFENDNPNND